MDSPPLAALACVALVVTAGCAGFGGQPAGDDVATPAPTGEPATTDGSAPTDPATTRATTDPGAESASETVAPGVTTDGVSNLSVLADAHAAHLQNTSYTITSSFADHREDGRIYSLTAKTLLFENERHWHQRMTAAGEKEVLTGGNPTGRSESYADGDRVYTRQHGFGDNSSYGTITYRNGDTVAPATVAPTGGFQWPVRQAFSNVTTTVVGSHEANGTTVYQVTGTAETTSFNGRNVTDYAASALVTEHGFVQRITITYHGDLDSLTHPGEEPTGTSTRRWQWTDVGETTVEQPDWYATALNRTETGEDGNVGN